MVRYSRVYADRLAAARARAEEKRARREDNYVEERRRERTRQATHAAIERGELVRPEVCGSCGGGGVIEAHHVDYDDPLNVRWLCNACHRAEHGGILRRGVE